MNTQLTPLELVLAELVAKQTISSDALLNSAVLNDIRADLERLGMNTKQIMHNGSPSLVASFTDFDTTRLWLAAHIDVVPGEQQSFKLNATNDKLTGRGAYDMKYAVASYLELVRELEPIRPKLGIILTSDEELGGQNGAGILAEHLNLKGSTVILPDGGGPWKLERKAKGGLWMQLAARGKAAHASRPYLGTNAIMLLISAIHELQTKLPHRNGEEFDDLTFIIGTIQGGTATNQLAESAQATVDIRFGSSHTLQEIEQAVASILSNHPDVSATTLLAAKAHNNNLDHPDTQLLQEVASQVLGHPLAIVDSNGATDAQFFAAAGAHTIVFYPDGGGHHSDNEFITRKSLEQFYQILTTFVVRRLEV